MVLTILVLIKVISTDWYSFFNNFDSFLLFLSGLSWLFPLLRAFLLEHSLEKGLIFSELMVGMLKQCHRLWPLLWSIDLIGLCLICIRSVFVDLRLSSFVIACHFWLLLLQSSWCYFLHWNSILCDADAHVLSIRILGWCILPWWHPDLIL